MDDISLKIDITGLKGLLENLRRYDRDLYKEVANELKTAAQPLANRVGAAFPARPPLSGWHQRGRVGEAELPGYDGGRARTGVKPIVYSGNKFVNKNVGILRLQQMNAGGAVYDGAGSAMAKRRGDRFIRNLDKHSAIKSSGNGRRSRVMFPTTKKNMPIIEDAVRKAIDTLNERIVDNLTSGY